jgi:hypothetical protein
MNLLFSTGLINRNFNGILEFPPEACMMIEFLAHVVWRTNPHVNIWCSLVGLDSLERERYNQTFAVYFPYSTYNYFITKFQLSVSSQPGGHFLIYDRHPSSSPSSPSSPSFCNTYTNFFPTVKWSSYRARMLNVSILSSELKSPSFRLGFKFDGFQKLDSVILIGLVFYIFNTRESFPQPRCRLRILTSFAVCLSVDFQPCHALYNWIQDYVKNIS